MSESTTTLTASAVTADQVRAWLGEARVKNLTGISNGRFEEHLKAACEGAEDVGLASLRLIQLCAGRVKPEELARATGAELPAPAETAAEVSVPDAKKPRKKK